MKKEAFLVYLFGVSSAMYVTIFTNFCKNTFQNHFGHDLIRYSLDEYYYHQCELDSWSSWGSCSLTCGNGFQQRQRRVCFYMFNLSLTSCLPSTEAIANAKQPCHSSCPGNPLRLVNGTMTSGRVEILYNNTWGTICDDGFTNQTAGVLCHMLGFSRIGAYYKESAPFGKGSGTIWLDDLVCKGSEASITQCQSNTWGVHNCHHWEDVGITCSTGVNHCESAPCLNSGTCTDTLNGFHCTCLKEYTGSQCEHEPCNEPPRVINCPENILEVNFTESKKVTLLSLFRHLPTIYGQSCDGVVLSSSFSDIEIMWSRNIQTFELVTNDTLGRSQTCVIRVHTKDMMPPIFENCPTSDIEQHGTSKGAVVYWSPIRVHDNSGDVTLTRSKSPGDMFPLGTHTVEYNAKDGSGNTNLCNFNVTVKKFQTECPIPPQVLHGSLNCTDLRCIINCQNGFLQSRNLSFICERSYWKPKIPDEFATSSCIEPEPLLLERNYTFTFTCPHLKFYPVDLRDCIYQSGLCPEKDISLCDKPFKRITGKHLSSSDLQIWTTLEGTLPYGSNRSSLVQRMDNHGELIAEYFTSGNFTYTCHQLMCDFGHIKVDPIQQFCAEGTVQEIIDGKPTCRKCGPGWYNDNKDCVPCGKGFYQDLEGQTDCKRCPDGKTSSMGTRLSSNCIPKDDKDTTSTMLSVIGISISGSLLVAFVILIVLVNKWRRHTKRQGFEIRNGNAPPVPNSSYEDAHSEVYDEIKEDRMLEYYNEITQETSQSEKGYEILPDKKKMENPYLNIR